MDESGQGGGQRLRRRAWVGDVLAGLGLPVTVARPQRQPMPARVREEDPVTKVNRTARRWVVGTVTVREPGPHDWTDGFMLPAFRHALESNHGRVARWYPLDGDQVVALMRSGQVFLARSVWDDTMQRSRIAVEPARRPDAEQRMEL